MSPSIKSDKVTERIFAYILELLEQHPEGLRNSELQKLIHEQEKGLHPKTVNGCVWKLVETFPDKVHKPERGLFQLIKFTS
jgi:hypothetical protein